jgi:hypothetical protein
VIFNRTVVQVGILEEISRKYCAPLPLDERIYFSVRMCPSVILVKDRPRVRELRFL